MCINDCFLFFWGVSIQGIYNEYVQFAFLKQTLKQNTQQQNPNSIAFAHHSASTDI